MKEAKSMYSELTDIINKRLKNICHNRKKKISYGKLKAHIPN
jgi:hypothetical protein